ncbi:hypothetical protein BOX15_Mlig029664g1 [Macrostomum lignano]|uniref:RNA-directed DNA polymerase n=1 Tax=Macrostomum lignano TaxID=282301 RepID=A0A267FFT6_9PLAT|nr:hypothetical protein BOX15_Mlig029664g1 [Macrostomum lignano]
MKISASVARGSHSTSSKCGRCGTMHGSNGGCPAKGKTCNKCGMQNHFATVCKTKSTGFGKGRKSFKSPSASGQFRRAAVWPRTTSFVDASEAEQEDCFHIRHPVDSYTVPVRLRHTSGSMLSVNAQIDTGAGVSVMSKTIWKRLGCPKLTPTDTVLTTYADTQMKVFGTHDTELEYNDEFIPITFFIVESQRNFVLVGRDKLNFTLNAVDNSCTSATQSCEFPPVTLKIKEGTTPIHCKPRPLPFALRQGVKDEIDRLLEEDTIKPVKFSEWASPIVVVKKPSGKLRLCVDYKVTINSHLISDSYPMPAPDEVIATAAGSRIYTRLDLEKAYHQIPLDEASKELTVMSTPFGMFAFNKLPFGVKTAPAIFQRYISQVLQGIPGVIAYVDDILICGKGVEQLAVRGTEVLHRLNQQGLKINTAKSEFRKTSIKFLGYLLEGDQLKPDPAKVKAIQDMTPPQNVGELESFLSLVNFSGKFIRNLAALTKPLNRLRKKNEDFEWTKECQIAFDEIKVTLSDQSSLQIFDPEKPIELECDSSQRALGGVLTQSGQVVLYMSKTLSDAETKYSQIEREGLALVWCIQRCHRFLYGRRFTLITDHRPLTYIFAPDKQLPTRVSARLQRWAIMLAAYDYVIQYRPSKLMLSDALSRLVPAKPNAQTASIGLLEADNPGVIQLDRIAHATREDPEFRCLGAAIINNNLFDDPHLLSYSKVQDELTVNDGIIYRMNRIVLPRVLRETALAAVHSTHLGVEKSKSILREQFWWPQMDRDIADYIGRCNVCNAYKSRNKNFRHSWPEPDNPWERVHIDFAGPIEGKYLLIIVDAHSSYPEVFITSDMKADTVISRLRRLFSQQGVPKCLVSDNGPSFVSEAVTGWLTQIGCSHITTPAYHPQSNGIAERMVRTVKETIKTNGLSQRSIDRFLLFYRAAKEKQQASPSELLNGRQIRLPISESSTQSKWIPGESLIYRASSSHEPRTVRFAKMLGSNTAVVTTETGRNLKTHLDQLRIGEVPEAHGTTEMGDSKPGGNGPSDDGQQTRPSSTDTEILPGTEQAERAQQQQTEAGVQSKPSPRRSERLAKKTRIFYRT